MLSNLQLSEWQSKSLSKSKYGMRLRAPVRHSVPNVRVGVDFDPDSDPDPDSDISASLSAISQNQLVRRTKDCPLTPGSPLTDQAAGTTSTVLYFRIFCRTPCANTTKAVERTAQRTQLAGSTAVRGAEVAKAI